VDKGQGPVATIIVQSGTLHASDVLSVRGVNYGRVRAMKAFDGKAITEAPPSTPVMILGFKEAPSVGDILEVPENVNDLETIKSQATKKSAVGQMTSTFIVRSRISLLPPRALL
jgi:translation initiation factor IF-2